MSAIVAHGPVLERRVVRQVSTASVARVVLGVGLSVVAIVMVGLVALWLFAGAAGWMRGVDGFTDAVFGQRLDPVNLLLLLMIAGIVASAVVTSFAAVVAVLYNLVAELLGGVEVVTRERADDGPRRW